METNTNMEMQSTQTPNSKGVIIGLSVAMLIVGGIIGYLLGVTMVDEASDQAISPTVSAQDTLTAEPVSYQAGIYPVTKSEFLVKEKISAMELQINAKDCGTDKGLSYYQNILDQYSSSDEGVVYEFGTKPEEWLVTVIPNKAGYKSMEDFVADFNICGAGGDYYPKMMNQNYLLFISSCSGGYGDKMPEVTCSDIQGKIESSLKLH